MLKFIGNKNLTVGICSKAYEKLYTISKNIKYPVVVSACVDALDEAKSSWIIDDFSIPKQYQFFSNPVLDKSEYIKDFVDIDLSLYTLRPLLGLVFPFHPSTTNYNTFKTILREIDDEYFFFTFYNTIQSIEYYNHELGIEDLDVKWYIDTSDCNIDIDALKLLLSTSIEKAQSDKWYDEYGSSALYGSSIRTISTTKPAYKNAKINKDNPSIESFGSGEFSIDMFSYILQAQQENLRRYFSKTLMDLYGKENTKAIDKFIFCKGNAPIMLVAHMDIKHRDYPVDIYMDKEKQVIWSPTGIGGDDRCGIYILLQVLNHTSIKEKPYILLTTDEEIGCVGAKDAADKLLKEVDGIKYLIELDRHGKDDVVFYETTNKDFFDFCEKFGFKKQEGLSSDIKYLTQKWHIASCNISVGYYNEHTQHEYIRVDEMMAVVPKVVRMVLASSDAPCYKDK